MSLFDLLSNDLIIHIIQFTHDDEVWRKYNKEILENGGFDEIACVVNLYCTCKRFSFLTELYFLTIHDASSFYATTIKILTNSEIVRCGSEYKIDKRNMKLIGYWYNYYD